MFDLDTFTYDPTFSDNEAFPVPFDLPLTPYKPEGRYTLGICCFDITDWLKVLVLNAGIF